MDAVDHEDDYCPLPAGRPLADGCFRADLTRACSRRSVRTYLTDVYARAEGRVEQRNERFQSFFLEQLTKMNAVMADMLTTNRTVALGTTPS